MRSSPQKLGRYEIARVIGKGAMGIVYEGKDPNIDRRVAIKTVHVEGMSPSEAREYEARFRTEARSAGRLQHPNIVSVYDADRHDNTAFLVMEYVHGEDLKDHIDRGRRFTLDETARIMFDLLNALGYAHKHNIVHRDIKPANLLMEKHGRVKLTDFGVARIQNSGEATRTRGAIVGTLKYMAPEQVQGVSVDSRADLFSAGVVLYQLLTDKRPFEAENDFQIMHQIVHDMPAPASGINTGLPSSIDAVLSKAMAKNRNERFADAESFESALRDAVLQAVDTSVMPPVNPLKALAFGSSGADAGTTGATATSGSSVTQEIELVYWKDVRDTSDPEELLGFLAKFPSGIYADLAKRRLKKLQEAQHAEDSTRLAGPSTFGSLDAGPPAASSARIEASANASAGAAALAKTPTPADAVIAGVVAQVRAADKAAGAQADASPVSVMPLAWTLLDPAPAAATQSAGVAPYVKSGGSPVGKGAKEVDKNTTVAKATQPEKPGRSDRSSKARSKVAEAKTSGSSQNAKAGGFGSPKWVLAALGAAAVAGLVWWLGAAPQALSDAAPAASSPLPSGASSDIPIQMVASEAAAMASAGKLPSGTEIIIVPTVPSAASAPTYATPASGAASAASVPRRAGSALRSRAASAVVQTVPSSGAASEPAQEAPKPISTPPSAPRQTTSVSVGTAASNDPNTACSGRVFISYQICLTEQCAKPQFAKSRACEERREMDRKRLEDQLKQ